VSVLQSKKDGGWYTGATNDLRKRYKEHSKGKVRETKDRGPRGLKNFNAICWYKSKAHQWSYFFTPPLPHQLI